ncbi:MAG: hypothetical protein AAF085_01120 [Planctomycetota bacterium]
MQTRFVILAALFALLLPAVLVSAAVTTDRKKGEASLQEAMHFEEDKVQLVELEADGIKLKAKLRIGDFFDKKIINANADVTNTGDQAKHFQYYIAFFDADGNLIGCTDQGSFGEEGLAAGKDTQLGSCLIELDPEDIKKVKSYQAVLYVGDDQIGK